MSETGAATGTVSATPWPNRTANTLIRKGLSRPPTEQLVFTAGEGALTAGDVAAIVARLCAGLAARGVGEGRRIAVDATQRLETYLVTLAALLQGATVVRLGDTVGPQALRAMVLAAPSVLTFSDRLDVIGDLAEVGEGIPLDAFAEFVAGCPDPAANFWADLPTVTPDNAAFVGFTSGSTGAPKAMETSHEAVFRSTEIAQRTFGFDTSDIFCTATDFTALSAFRSLVTLPFASGGRVVIPDAEARDNPVAMALLCERYGVTRLTAVPAVLRAFAKAGARITREELASIRTIFSGSGVLDFATADLLRERFSLPVVDYYGGREFATAAYSDPDTPHTMSAGGGFVRDCLAIIVDDNRQPVESGEVGEIVVHSDCMTLSPLPSIETAGDWAGWHFTGDLGRFLPGDRLEIVGRKKDVIKTAEGTLVSPAEIEGALNAIDWVIEACVFSWTDSHGIERIGAAMIGAPASGDAERTAKAAVRDALGPYKTPARILVLDDLPRLARRKPDKAGLRQRLTQAEKASSP
ncbi:MAG: acyl--CoA ligase [Roseitalea sp.]|jgi:acyl-coenzyme A synthetase/AMP-(fatty) acid ligase|nr:acyl--CoA ligase [Roseitalea sp.]MBO6723549.1 acyl--CoA ligase [Roseitalea sp.]MBO6744300.1 acyl--CoA ligase [Roseitalea sp.]